MPLSIIEAIVESKILHYCMLNNDSDFIRHKFIFYVKVLYNII